MSDSPILWRIIAAVVVGMGVGIISLALVARSGKRPVQWRMVGASVAIALSATCAAMLLGILTSPDGGPTLPDWVIQALAIVLMPVSSALALWGQHSLSAVLFFGGFALNIVVWSVAVYLVMGKRRAARA